MRVVWDLFQLSSARDIVIQEVESDSLQVVHMLQNRIDISWKCRKWWRRIRRMYQFDIGHCFRESNGAADFLAKDGGRLPHTLSRSNTRNAPSVKITYSFKLPRKLATTMIDMVLL